MLQGMSVAKKQGACEETGGEVRGGNNNYTHRFKKIKAQEIKSSQIKAFNGTVCTYRDVTSLPTEGNDPHGCTFGSSVLYNVNLVCNGYSS